MIDGAEKRRNNNKKYVKKIGSFEIIFLVRQGHGDKAREVTVESMLD